MAHESTRIGGASEALAQAMFLQNGFSVFTSVVPEVYDLIVIGKDDEGTNVPFTVQVKTIKIRHDREGQLVVNGSNKGGKPYPAIDVDYLFGVHVPTSTGFLIPNNEQVEYWAKDFEVARSKWTEFTLGDNSNKEVTI